MNDEIEILESTPSKIRYNDIVWVPETKGCVNPTTSMSSKKIMKWLTDKNIPEYEFELDDLRSVFPEWSRYAKSQLIFKINPLIKDKTIQQLSNDKFKVLKLD